MPRVLTVDPHNPEPAVIAEAAGVLAAGGLVAFPTETVYGLGARGLEAGEVRKIFAAKRRPPRHPLILHVHDEAAARSLAEWSSDASLLAAAFWPGPLTLVVPNLRVPAVVTGGLSSVGLRMPASPIALALVRAAGPLAAPSANAHMHVSPTTAAHVVRSLGDAVDLVLDGGPCAHGIESTVVDVAGRRVLRPGALSLERLRAVVPDVVYDAIVAEDDALRASPGLAARHYAPNKRVRLVDAPEPAPRRGIIARAPRLGPHVVVLPADPDGYARGLFAALHALDAADVDEIVIERVPEGEAWWAIADRLARACRE